MYNIERLHETYANPSNERQSGKTIMNCFNLAGYIDVLHTSNIVVFNQNHAISDYFALTFERVLIELDFEFEKLHRGSDIIFTIKDYNNLTKIVTLTIPNEEKIRGLDAAIYYIDHNSIDNCYLDLSMSGIPSENNDYSPLTKA